MHIKNKDRYLIAEAYNTVKECECNHAAAQNAASNSSEERVDMVINNLVNLNNKAAELVRTIQTAVDSGEGIEEWASEKIAVAASMITSINDYYAKFKTDELSTVSLNNLVGNGGSFGIKLPTNNSTASISI